jgi:hypothetical protein
MVWAGERFMSIAMAYAIPLAVVAGAALPVLLLRGAPRSGRGWCRRCQTPDLWVLSRATARSRVWALLAWVAHAGLTWGVWTCVRSGGLRDLRDGAILGLLILAEVLLAQRSRQARRRIIRCRMCEAEAEPQDLRRAKAGPG